MPTFRATGRLTLDGVTFTITARSIAEAKSKARRLEFDSADRSTAHGAESFDIDEATVELDR